jgi:hypothetical protein
LVDSTPLHPGSHGPGAVPSTCSDGSFTISIRTLTKEILHSTENTRDKKEQDSKQEDGLTHHEEPVLALGLLLKHFKGGGFLSEDNKTISNIEYLVDPIIASVWITLIDRGLVKFTEQPSLLNQHDTTHRTL